MGKCYFQVIFSYFEKYTLNTPLYLDLYFYHISDAIVTWLGYRSSTKGENEVDVCPSEVYRSLTLELSDLSKTSEFYPRALETRIPLPDC